MNVLVGYENSSESHRVTELAKRYGKSCNAKIYILTSTPYGPESGVKEYEEAKLKLEQLKGDFIKSGIECQIHLADRSLSPGDDLLEFAESKSIDLIIIGIKKRSRVGKLIMGSTAQYVILESKCPVLTVK